MTRCWLHLGMPKTGTTSIQETLYFELNDPAVIYCSFGQINGSYGLNALVGQSSYLGSLQRATPAGDAEAMRRTPLRRFRRCLARARATGADLIVSAEFAYGWPESAHQNWLTLVREHGLTPGVIVYLRPPLDWLASGLAEVLKYGRLPDHRALADWHSTGALRKRLALHSRLERLALLYGENQLIVRPFLRRQLSEGCVVRDFCRQLGIATPRRIHRQNERLSLIASQCLHRHNIARGSRLRGPLDLLRRDALLTRLARLFADGAPLRLERAFLGDLEPFVLEQLELLQRHFGLTLPLNGSTAGGDGLTSLEPLLELPEAARCRLAEAIGADLTAEQCLARLEARISGRHLLGFSHRLARRELRHALHGC